MKKTHLFYLIPLVSTLLFGSLNLFDPAVIREQLESRAYDLRLNIKNYLVTEPPSKNIFVVAIDEKSIADIGRWPWSRNIMAELIARISDGRPKVIGLDVMYSEKESAQADEKFAKAIKDAGNVVLATAFIVPEGEIQTAVQRDIPDSLWDAAFMIVRGEKEIQWKKFAVNADSVLMPITQLAAVSTLGHVYSHPDRDGSLRWGILYLRYGDDFYPSLALQVSRLALGIEMKDMALYGGSGIKLGDKFINTDLSGRVLTKYAGSEHSYQYISASDIVKMRVSPEIFRDRIVLVGTSALATYDQKVIPLSANMPGVEVNANIIDNILANDFITKSHGVIELLLIVFMGIFLGLTVPRMKAIPGASLGIGVIVLYMTLASYLLIYEGLWINVIYPVSNMLFIFIGLTVAKYFFEEKRAREIKAMFSSYVTERVVNELIKNPDMAKLGGERREITVLFSDVRGFTSFSERYSPEEVVTILNEYLGEMTDIVFKWEGTLDKFIGDAILAFWGAPLQQENHAELAVRCALDMVKRLDELQQRWKQEGRPLLDCGVGINTGEVIVGNIGAEGKKMDYTIIGDHVNLGSRVEALTRKYDTHILLTEFTVNKLRDRVFEGALGSLSIKGLGNVIVKGKENPVVVYELKALEEGAMPVITESENTDVVRMKDK